MTRKIVSFLCIVFLVMFFGCDGGCGTGEEIDKDADGFSSSQGDCDDHNPAVNPSASETCNGIDDNCDGQMDEGCYWNKTFGGYARDIAYSVIPGNNGGYVIAGLAVHYYNLSETNGDAWIMQIDENGNILWNKTFGASEDMVAMATSIIRGNTGGYVIAGMDTDMMSGEGVGWVIKIDDSGNMLWKRSFCGTDNKVVMPTCVIQGNIDGYVIARSADFFGGDVHIIKIDDNGNEQWHQVISSITFVAYSSVIQGNNGGYVIAGSTYDNGTGDENASIIKIDENSNEQWHKTFGGNETGDIALSVTQGNNDGYVVAGLTYPYDAGNEDAWIIKIDENGNELWNKTFGGNEADGAWSVTQGNYGGYVIAGETVSYGAGNRDAWIFKIDENGNELWNKTFGGNEADGGWSVTQGNYGGYVIAGWTDSYGSGSAETWVYKADAWIIKIDENGNAPAMPGVLWGQH